MKIECIPVGDLQTNCYIISNLKKQALIIDPGAEAEKIKNKCQNYQVLGILITHYHWDHIGALFTLEQEYQIRANNYHGKEFFYEKIITKGHTKDSVSYYFPQEKWLFDGDFIFANAIGRTDLGGNKKEMKKSLEKIMTYPKETIIYPGHGPKTTLAKEAKWFSCYLKSLEK